MPFGGFKDFADCVQKQIAKKKSPESAKKICGSIKHKVEDVKQLELEIIKLEVKRDSFILNIAKGLIDKMSKKFDNKIPTAEDIRAFTDIIYLYRSERRDLEEPGDKKMVF